MLRTWWWGVASVAALLLCAGDAAAQRRGSAPIEVTSWAPRSGPVGTDVTLRGTGLNRRGVSVLVGGRRVRPRRAGRGFLTVVIPRRPGDGRLVVRHPEMADDLVVGTFEVLADPKIASVSPRSGVPGARVEIRGSGFRPGDVVLFNERSLPTVERSDSRLVIEVPPGARSGFVVVERPGGPSARSREPFRVVQPAPRITGMTPDRGTGGSRVTLAGENFTPNDQVRYGRARVTVVESADDALVVVVPVSATRNEFFTVVNENGRARTAKRFGLERPPVIRSFSPAFGKPGSSVRIDGLHFAPDDAVFLDEQPLRTVQLTERTIVAAIPDGARSGSLSVVRGDRRVTSDRRFDVVHPPTVARVDPPAAGAGATVTIRGTHFARDVRAFLGTRRLWIVDYKEEQLVFKVPRGARSGAIRVVTRGGEARSEVFEVQVFSAVRSVRPRTAARGARLTIRGKGFGASDRFWLGDVELPVVSRRLSSAVVELPSTATTGRLAWTSHGRRFESRLAVEVLEPPSITSVAPAAGRPGSRVVLSGAHFTGRAQVRWGSARLPVLRRSPTQLTVRLPRRASGSAYFYVVDRGGKAVSPTEFQVSRGGN